MNDYRNVTDATLWKQARWLHGCMLRGNASGRPATGVQRRFLAAMLDELRERKQDAAELERLTWTIPTVAMVPARAIPYVRD